MTTLREEVDRWQADLEDIAETSQADSWFLEERRLVEAQHTLIAFRGRIIPALTAQRPGDRIVVDEIERLLDNLEDLRNHLYRTVHPADSHRRIAETIAALHALTRVAVHFEPTVQPAS
ncbi:hypothetical protein [Kribbella sp.]|uniref:hypothetical protein n=1 Tax=Kribbella sp. TaxID=1871183 RepID=UPI002D5F94E5|nr:hypothetical protein [Kribbella sp.]HZX04650.1 hypothetical protein [Kribbella sp.]